MPPKEQTSTSATSRQPATGRRQPSQDPCLGVLRIDYNYPPIAGDIDHPASYDYDVYYKVVPGLTFEMTQKGELTPQVQKRFIESIQWLIKEKNVNVITGDCGFMVSFQEIAQVEAERLGRPVPIILSALAQTGMIGHSLALNEKMMIMTANEANLKAIQCLIKEQAGTDCSDPRFVIVGCENVPGFEAVANGDKVFPEIVEPGVVELAKEKN
ncbi:uncharacterized protein LOC142340136 isoform X2 [Convolutriloba macropyga]|uniref:uncharacterized protein LOC142340136 isoform X2 n=1 Tax=Convolutriloba macropyga TaxID=536237 RepID=UPI003F524849